MNNTFSTPVLYKFSRGRSWPFILARPFRVKTSHETSEGTISAAITGKLSSTVNYFDRVLGIAEVRDAQAVVTEAEEEFMKSRRNVQESGTELAKLQSQLRELRSKLDRIPREDERYLQLATEEHKVLIDERKLKTDLEGFISLERDNFTALSTAVRNAHEKERSRAERTKYWSIIGSACGAVLGILGSTLINIRRMKQIKLTVQENNQAFMTKTLEELKLLGETGDTSSPSPHNKTLNDTRTLPASHVLLTENGKMLSEIREKVERITENTDPNSVKYLAPVIQELKQELLQARSPKRQLVPLSESSSALLDFERDFNEVLWWSKAGMTASVVTSISCSVLLYFLYK